MTDSMNLDFTNTSDTGYELIPVGIYEGMVTEIHRRIKDNGNTVFDIDFDIMSGEYKDKSLRYWVTIVPDKEFTKSQFLQLLHNLGITDPSDRGEGGMLSVNLDFASIDENGRQKLLNVTVNGTKRKAEGKYAKLHVGVKPHPDTGVKNNWIDKVEKVGDSPVQSGTTLNPQARPKVW